MTWHVSVQKYCVPKRVLTPPVHHVMHGVLKFTHVNTTVDMLLERVAADGFLSLQGVTVVLTVRVYAGERIVHVNASLYLLTTIPFVLGAAGLLAVRFSPNHLPVLTIDRLHRSNHFHFGALGWFGLSGAYWRSGLDSCAF